MYVGQNTRTILDSNESRKFEVWKKNENALIIIIISNRGVDFFDHG